MLDKIIVTIVVAVALFFFLRSLYQTFTGQKSGCGGGCSGCNAKANTSCDGIPDERRLL